ncbi:MAG: PAS domain S-box protein, partial [Woeseia sp.]
MRQDRDEGKAPDQQPAGDHKPGMEALLKVLEEHYDKMEATITRSLTQTLPATTPIEVIFDSVTDALMSVGANGTIRNCNKVCTRYFGMPKQELIGSSLDAILPGATTPSIVEFLAPFMSDLDDTHIEFNNGEVEARKVDGTTFVAEINATCLNSGDETIFVINLRDITERRDAEQALRENEERYRALVENAPEAIVVLDVDSGHFSDANDKACQLFNLSRKRLLSVGPDAISPKMQPDGQPSFGVRRGYVDRALDGEHPTFEWLHKDSSGREIPCEVRFSRLPARERRLIRVSITDITERKRAEELAYAQNKILEMIAASTPFDRTLRSICRCSEKVTHGLRAAIMIVDPVQHTLHVEEAPSLPDAVRAGLDQVAIGDKSIACGSAAHRGRETITADIAADPAWKWLHAAAAEHKLAACWSFPLLASAGHVIGTLDVYMDEPRQPTTDELDKLGRMAKLAGIAVKRQLDEDKLRSSESRYRGLFENVVDGVYITSRDGEIITVNPALVEMLGYDSA